MPCCLNQLESHLQVVVIEGIQTDCWHLIRVTFAPSDFHQEWLWVSDLSHLVARERNIITSASHLSGTDFESDQSDSEQITLLPDWSNWKLLGVALKQPPICVSCPGWHTEEPPEEPLSFIQWAFTHQVTHNCRNPKPSLVLRIWIMHDHMVLAELYIPDM